MVVHFIQKLLVELKTGAIQNVVSDFFNEV